MSENKDNGGAPEDSQNLEQLQAELQKSKNDYLYLLADFDNYRKNAIKERSDMSKYGCERLIRDLLNVVDDFERALESELTEENAANFRKGVQMIASELKSLLQKNGVSELKSEGLPFDPNMHEALSSEPTTNMPAGHVLRTFKKAYKLHDRLVRPAQVVVSTDVTKQDA